MAVADDFSGLSPMMKQYMDVKRKYAGHILFFRLGDFYEMFFDDAVQVSRELELTLTGRDCGLSERAPMCGIPYHSAEIYIKRLIENGHRVAICEQISDPKDSKGIVERDVIRVVTPGTLTEGTMLDETKNNYIAAVFVKDEGCSLCFADISTGEVHLFIKKGRDVETEVINELSRFSPVEILYNRGFLKYAAIYEYMKNRMKASLQLLKDDCFDINLKKEVVLRQFTASEFDDIGLKEDGIETCCACGLFDYIHETQKSLIGRFTDIKRHDNAVFMEIDMTARQNLELIETIRSKEKKGSLLWVLDNTQTSMGKRLLKKYIEQPLIVPAVIINRLDAVSELCNKPIITSGIMDELARVYDLERLMTRVMYKSATPRDIKALSQTALRMPEIKRLLSGFASKLLISINDKTDTLEEISNLIERAIVDEPPANAREGGMIRDGFNPDLDKLRNAVNGGKRIMDDIELRERERTGIKNLKLGYNRVFGYYIEVTKSYYHLIPEDYIRKQTLANCERFITDEVKKAEYEILGASDRIIALESDIFSEVRDFIASKLVVVQETAYSAAQLDVLCSFAYISVKNNYTRPEITMNGIIDIKDGRHPVVEITITDETYVPNDAYLDLKDNRMCIITGPNMSGKSTYMRQTALIVLMAQMGCFVPAGYAGISIVDKIFTRVGASDDLTMGQSTFMVEMSEVASILKNATKNSLVILDEVGRGTSTYDGISIATAVAEYITSGRLGCKTLFATHYHELIRLEKEHTGIKNLSVAVRKRGEDIKFLRKIVRGGIDDSYGIEVAKLAGLPSRVITRAKQLLGEMEKEKSRPPASEPDGGQISFIEISGESIVEKLRKINIDEFSADDAKYFLSELIILINSQG